MTIAHVVPLRRLPSDVPWFDYLVPNGHVVERGQFVTVPFRHQQLRGVVWSFAAETSIANLATIAHVESERLTDWQLRVIDALVAAGGSAGSIITSAIPKILRRPRGTSPSQARRTASPSRPLPPPPTWWYRDRAEAAGWIQDWAVEQTASSSIILTPTVEEADRFVTQLTAAGLPAYAVHALTTAAAYRHTYQLASQQPLVIIGTWKALLLPFKSPPRILIDQEEHSAHKQTLQYPRYDVRRIVQQLDLQPVVTTPASSINWFHTHHPVPPPDDRPRQLGSLGTPGSHQWLSSPAQDLLTAAHDQHCQLVCIVPRRGFASLITCNDCGHVLECRQCHRQLTLRRSANHTAQCSWCQHRQPLPSECPACHGTRWAFRGLGPEQFVEVLTKFAPDLIAVPAVNRAVDATVYVDTYHAVRYLTDVPKLAGIIVVSGDSLLNIPDPTASERAWQYLNRLQAAAPRVPLIVQTFQPETDYWQRWLDHNDAAWYQHEVQERQRLQLPPFTEVWLVRYNGPDREQTVASKLHELLLHHRATCTIQRLPDTVTPQRTTAKLLISSSRSLRELIDVPNEFPAPWQVDMSPGSWLD